MSTSITRRAAMTGTAAGAAATVTGTGPALAVDHDRAEWLALWLDYMRKERALEELPDDSSSADEDAVNEARWAAGDAIREKSATTLNRACGEACIRPVFGHSATLA